jgi:hypothetical protein
LAETTSSVVPLPLAFAIEMLTHGTGVDAVHEQPTSVRTAMETLPPSRGTWADVRSRSKRHADASWLSITRVPLTSIALERASAVSLAATVMAICISP